jgi:hypothetical protein
VGSPIPIPQPGAILSDRLNPFFGPSSSSFPFEPPSEVCVALGVVTVDLVVLVPIVLVLVVLVLVVRVLVVLVLVILVLVAEVDSAVDAAKMHSLSRPQTCPSLQHVLPQHALPAEHDKSTPGQHVEVLSSWLVSTWYADTFE